MPVLQGEWKSVPQGRVGSVRQVVQLIWIDSQVIQLALARVVLDIDRIGGSQRPIWWDILGRHARFAGFIGAGLGLAPISGCEQLDQGGLA